MTTYGLLIFDGAEELDFAALPLAAVLAAQPFLHTSTGLFGWARIATAAWALLYVVLSLDPAIRDKIDTANQVAGILHNTRSTN
jgi:hypothetical protein